MDPDLDPTFSLLRAFIHRCFLRISRPSCIRDDGNVSWCSKSCINRYFFDFFQFFYYWNQSFRLWFYLILFTASLLKLYKITNRSNTRPLPSYTLKCIYLTGKTTGNIQSHWDAYLETIIVYSNRKKSKKKVIHINNSAGLTIYL